MTSPGGVTGCVGPGAAAGPTSVGTAAGTLAVTSTITTARILTPMRVSGAKVSCTGEMDFQLVRVRQTFDTIKK